LVLWEAQFGDFANAAQVIIDQFISSAEDKWQRLNALVLLLPHGFEGQGPEHSSARLERFLSLCAEDNMQVVYPSTPAQYFHVLRRQVLRPYRKPLIVMTPKSLLRLPACTSPLSELAGGAFKRVIGDQLPAGREVTRVLLCAGKVYYDLAKAREERGREDVAILRLEQLYPFKDAALQRALIDYPVNTPVYWVQEEPENMGAWRYLLARFGTTLWGAHPFEGIFREASASPATGFMSSHRLEQEILLEAAFAKH
jgi:2-oxoglutarate dehydrogenase E1 component